MMMQNASDLRDPYGSVISHGFVEVPEKFNWFDGSDFTWFHKPCEPFHGFTNHVN
jgi:hypothetical protein